jgi:hypothetical protein
MPDGDTSWIIMSALIELRDFLKYRQWAAENGQRAVSLSSFRVVKSQWKNRPWDTGKAVS